MRHRWLDASVNDGAIYRKDVFVKACGCHAMSTPYLDKSLPESPGQYECYPPPVWQLPPSLLAPSHLAAMSSLFSLAPPESLAASLPSFLVFLPFQSPRLQHIKKFSINGGIT